MFYVLPYRRGSNSARELAEGLGGRRIRLEGSRYRPRPRDVIINWGNVDCPFPQALNAMGLREVTNKLNFFERLRDAGLTPRYWRNQNDIPDDAFPIVCRTVLAGHSGEGIVIADNRGDLVPCSLYVEYKKKCHEFRIHVGQPGGNNSPTISVQQKLRRREFDGERDPKVRNVQNGYIYARNDIVVPEEVFKCAHDTFEHFDIDFGAVDVIYNERYNQAYALEINTAPGISGTTITDYVNYFRGL